MINVVNQLIQCRKDRQDIVLVGIIESSGSLPRKKGAYMIVGSDGLIAGTVGGGNLEYQAVMYAMKQFESGVLYTLKRDISYSIIPYELNLKDSAELGMVCGGSAKLLFYPIYWNEIRLEQWLTDWKNALEKGNSHRLIFYDLNALEDAEHTTLKNLPVIYQEMIHGDGTVYIFGAGHLARELVPLLAHLDFHCVVLDDREEFANPDYFPDAKEVRLVDFLHLEQFICPKEDDYIVIMTRGHQYDLYAEAFSLQTKVHYIGVVGSRKKTAFVNDKLRKMGFDEENIARIITPVGLDIGSETPGEIAISIVAQLIDVRAKKRSC